MRAAWFLLGIVGCGTSSNVPADSGSLDASDAANDTGSQQEAASDAGVSPMLTIAMNQDGIKAIAVDATNVYWTVTGAVRKCAITGCAKPTDVAINQGDPRGVATNGSTVVWADYTGKVMSCPTSGCMTPTLLASDSSPIAIAIDASSVYWTNYGGLPGTGSVMKCALSNCVPTPVAMQQSHANAVAVDAVSVFWAADQVRSCPLAGCVQPVDLANDQATALALGGDSVYWSPNAAPGAAVLRGCTKSNCSSPSDLAIGLTNVLSIAADDKNVYWTNMPDALLKCDRLGCAQKPTTFAMPKAPNAVALDATSVYFASTDNGKGSILRFTPK